MLLFDVLAEAEREGKLLLTSAETERVGKCKPCPLHVAQHDKGQLVSMGKDRKSTVRPLAD